MWYDRQSTCRLAVLAFIENPCNTTPREDHVLDLVLKYLQPARRGSLFPNRFARNRNAPFRPLPSPGIVMECTDPSPARSFSRKGVRKRTKAKLLGFDAVPVQELCPRHG